MKELFDAPPEEVRDGTFRRIEVAGSDTLFSVKVTTAPRCRPARFGQRISFSRDRYRKETWPLYPITIVGVLGGGAVAGAFADNWIVSSAAGTAAIGPLIGYVFLPNEYLGKTETQSGEVPLGQWTGEAHACEGLAPTPSPAEPLRLVATFEDSAGRLSWSGATATNGTLTLPNRELVQRVAFFCGAATVAVLPAVTAAPPPEDSPLAPRGELYTDPLPALTETGRAGALDDIRDAPAREIASDCAASRRVTLSGLPPRTAVDQARSAP